MLFTRLSTLQEWSEGNFWISAAKGMMDYWNDGMLDYWNDGMMECWIIGMMDYWNNGMLE